MAKRSKTNFKVVGIILVVLALFPVGYYAVNYYMDSLIYESTDDAFIEGHVVAISPKISGHISKVHVRDNQVVHQGDLLVEIDPRDFEVKLLQSQATLNAALATVEQGDAQLLAAKAEANRTSLELKRYEELRTTSSISQLQLDNARAAAQSAAAQVVAAQKQITLAQAKAAESQTAVDQARLQLSYTKISAPQDGRVTKKAAEQGAYVSVGQPLLAIVPAKVWVIANYKETQLNDMRPGQKASIRVDAYPEMRFNGHVDSIQAGTGARFSLLPSENATGNYVKVVQRVPVKIVFEADSNETHLLAPGMSVVPRVKIK